MRSASSDGLRSRLLHHLAERKKAEDRLLKEYVERLRARIPRSAILLIGSRARGEHLPYSDYDIMVVLERVEDKLRATEELRALKPRGISLDLIVISRDELDDPIIRKMLEGSVVLYDGLGLRPS